MAKFNIDKKILASSTCNLKQSQSDVDPLFCKVNLLEDAIVILNQQLLKKDELLFFIPIHYIKKFDFIKEKKENKGKLKSFLEGLLKAFLYVSGWIGLFPEYARKEDILGLSYLNEKGQNVDFILNMMKYGENGLVREYKNLICQRQELCCRV